MPEVFGWQHLTYLAVFLAIAITATFLICKYAKSEKILTLIMRIVGGILLVCVVWNRITLVMKYDNAWLILPDTFCGISSFILSLALLIGKKDNLVFHFICYLGFVGGLVVVIYPDFIGQDASIFYPPTISGLLHHTIMLYAIILMIITKYFVPTIKKWYVLPLGLCCVMTFGIFEISVLHFEDAMQIFSPLLPDTILTWWFCGILLLPLAYATMCIFDYFNVWRKSKSKPEVLS